MQKHTWQPDRYDLDQIRNAAHLGLSPAEIAAQLKTTEEILQTICERELTESGINAKTYWLSVLRKTTPMAWAKLQLGLTGTANKRANKLQTDEDEWGELPPFPEVRCNSGEPPRLA